MEKREKHPHEKVLDQIAELLQFAYDHANKPIPYEKVGKMEAQLDELDKQLEEFKRISDKILEGSGLTDYLFETIKRDRGSPVLSEAERTLLERADFLKGEAQAASQNLQQAAENAQIENKQLTSKQEKKSDKLSRKGKFRSFGSIKNWKPL